MGHRNCLECGTSFVPSRFRPNHTHCSDRCATVAYERTAPLFDCRYCLRPFRTRDKRSLGFCSRSCGHKASRLGQSCSLIGHSCPLTWRTCDECGERYHSRSVRRHCWPHTSKSGRQYNYQPTKPRALSCVDCHAPIVGKQGPKQLCGVCAWERGAAHRQAAKARRRGRMRAGTTETVYRKRVYQRDGWRCQLCGRLVRSDAKAPHPDSPTLDHIVPLSAGGEHSYRNVQLAHFYCNSKRGAKGDAQMRLIA